MTMANGQNAPSCDRLTESLQAAAPEYAEPFVGAAKRKLTRCGNEDNRKAKQYKAMWLIGIFCIAYLT